MSLQHQTKAGIGLEKHHKSHLSTKTKENQYQKLSMHNDKGKALAQGTNEIEFRGIWIYDCQALHMVYFKPDFTSLLPYFHSTCTLICQSFNYFTMNWLLGLVNYVLVIFL
jgi:hypothetical protein